MIRAANSALVAATSFCLRRAMAVPKSLSGQRRSAWSLVDWLEGPAVSETSKRSENGVKTLLNLRKIFKQKELSNLHKLGIGGLNAEFGSIFRRAFASRLLPHDTVKKLGIKHVKGMLLYGPPGTGKTLVARQISKILNGKKDPKIVNGPELLNCYTGESERNVRKLFADAEIDQKQYGDKSDLHVIIFDEIDAICKKRSGSEFAFYNDGIVNTLLTTLDGVNPLDNVLVIGLTNRKELLDEALLRPGRLEVHVELSLPDETGRLQILQIHTSKIKESNVLAPDVNLGELATLTETYSGAEIEGVVRSAVSFAINRQLSLDDLEKPVDEGSVKVTMDDFRRALQEIRPSNYGASREELERCRMNGIENCGDRHRQTYEKVMLLVEQAKSSEGNSLVKCLLEGPSGSGKSVLAASIGLQSRFPFVKMISSESMIGLHHEESKCAYLENVFQEAYKSELSIIILDDIDRLMEFIPNSSRFSTKLYQTLWNLLKSYPPNKGNKLMVIGTTSELEFLDSVGFCKTFSHTYNVPTLSREDAKEVLQQLNVFAEEDIDAAADALNDMPIKKLYTSIETAASQCAKRICSGGKKINISDFLNCLRDMGRTSSVTSRLFPNVFHA